MIIVSYEAGRRTTPNERNLRNEKSNFKRQIPHVRSHL